MTGMLIDRKGLAVLMFSLLATVWHNGSHRLTISDVYVALDIVTTMCVLNILAFLPALWRLDTRRWTTPWNTPLSGRGGPPSNAATGTAWQHYFALPPAQRQRVRAMRMGPACKAWPHTEPYDEVGL